MPHHEKWEEQGYVDRDVWLKAGEQGLLCTTMPEEYGGAGVDKLLSASSLIEEMARAASAASASACTTTSSRRTSLHYGTEAQKKKYLPRWRAAR